MKSLTTYITEKFRISKNMGDMSYNYHPKDKKELKAAIQEHYANNIYNLNDIDVSNITDFSYMFYDCHIEDKNKPNITKL